MRQRFFNWYERYYTLNVGIAAGLFSLQLIHLYWLSAHVVAHKVLGQSYLELPVILDTSKQFLSRVKKVIT